MLLTRRVTFADSFSIFSCQAFLWQAMLGVQLVRTRLLIGVRQRFAPSMRSFCLATDDVDDEVSLAEIQQANARKDRKVEIRETDGRGWGIFALNAFLKGDVVIAARAMGESSFQGTHTIQTDWKRHVYMDLPATMLNHVCSRANVGVRPNEMGAYDFVAMRDIEKDEEVVMDYESTEYEIESFTCMCGAPKCRGVLQGFNVHGKEVLKAYGEENVAPYLLHHK